MLELVILVHINMRRTATLSLNNNRHQVKLVRGITDEVRVMVRRDDLEVSGVMGTCLIIS